MTVYALIAAALLAQDAAPSLFPGGYLDHAGLTAALRRVETAHPDRVRLRSLVKSAEGREVWLVTLNPAPADAPPRPAVLVVGNLEADHVIGGQVALGTIERLAADPEFAKVLENKTVYVVPRLNPDGAERVLKPPLVGMRTNLRPIDRDRDGLTGEDGPDDLDGDGVAARMRVKNARATLVPDDRDPRILRPADTAKGEHPTYSEYTEGIDNDADGALNEDPPGGVNLNRNWPHRWTEFDPEAGVSPASEPETHALIQFAYDHPEIAVVWTFSLNDTLRFEPKKPESTLDDADLPLFVPLSKEWRALLKEKPEPKPAELTGATTDGALSEWAYHQYGAIGFTTRPWVLPELPAPADGKPAPPADGEARWLYWNDHVMGGKAFVPFRSFSHPTLGPVTIGGWRPGVQINPPIEQAGTLAAAPVEFLKAVLSKLPRVELADVKVEAKGGGLFAVSAAVTNEGAFPTSLAQGVRTRKAPPVLLRLDSAGAKIVAGRAGHRIDTLAGAGGRREFQWLLLAPATSRSVTLEASCPRGGRATRTITLPLEKR